MKTELPSVAIMCTVAVLNLFSVSPLQVSAAAPSPCYRNSTHGKDGGGRGREL